MSGQRSMSKHGQVEILSRLHFHGSGTDGMDLAKELSNFSTSFCKACCDSSWCKTKPFQKHSSPRRGKWVSVSVLVFLLTAQAGWNAALMLAENASGKGWQAPDQVNPLNPGVFVERLCLLKTLKLGKKNNHHRLLGWFMVIFSLQYLSAPGVKFFLHPTRPKRIMMRSRWK